MSLEELKKRRDELLKRKVEREAKIAEYRETHAIEFVKFYPHQQRALELVNAGKKTVLLQGANQIGKTVFGACMAGAFALGIQPWDRRPTVFGDKPTRGRIICEDWEKHAKTVIVPELKRWLPAGAYRTQKNNVGIEDTWTFDNGSDFTILTNMQETKLHESWHGDWVWADEPTSREKYEANKRGLLASHGVFLMTMTAVKESWVLDDIVRNTDPSFGSVTQIPMTANPSLTKEAIDQYAASLTEDSKLSRIRGEWLNLVGLIWKDFNIERHICRAFEVPVDWPVVAMIDFHTSLPHAVCYYAVNKQEVWHAIDETWERKSPEQVADGIIRMRDKNHWRLKHAFIDPFSKGDVQYTNMRGIEIEDSYTVIERRLRKHGIHLEVASKDKDSGIVRIEQMLKGPNGQPTLLFFDTLVNKINREGTIWEIQRWSYDDKGKPKDDADHFMENLYRMSLTGVKWSELEVNVPVFESSYNPLTYGLAGA